MTAADDDRKRLIVIGPRNILFKTHTLITHTQMLSLFLPRTSTLIVIILTMFNVIVLLCFRFLLKKRSLNILSQQHHHHPSAFFHFVPRQRNMNSKKVIAECECVRASDRMYGDLCVFACLFANKHECVHTISSAVRPFYIYTHVRCVVQCFCCFGMFVSKTE